PSASRLASAPISAARSSGPQVMPMRRLLDPRNVPARNRPCADSTVCASTLIVPSARPASASCAASLASRCTTLAPPSALENSTASGLPGTMAARSSSVMPVSRPLMRTSSCGRLALGALLLRKSSAAARAAPLRSGAIESSRSTMTASAPLATALSSFEPPSAGTKRRERMCLFRPLDDEHVAVALGDELAVLLEALMMEFDDAGVRARLRFALGDDGRLATHGVAFEQRVGEAHVRHAEIGNGRSDGHVGDLDADHQAEREQRVHQRLAELGLGLAEMAIDVQRLRVERHVGEQHVVHLRHRARVAVLVELADLHVLEIEAAAPVPLRRVSHRRLLVRGPRAAVNRSFTIIAQGS